MMINNLLLGYLANFCSLLCLICVWTTVMCPPSPGKFVILLHHSLGRLNFVCGAISGLLRVPLVLYLETRCDN